MLDLEFRLKSSKQYLLLFALLVLASIAIVLSLTLALWLKLIGIILIAAYGIFILIDVGLRWSPRSIIALRRHPDGMWLLQTPEKHYEGALRGDSTVTQWISVLRFQIPQQYKPKTCIIFRDSLEPDEYRRLLVILRMGKD